jgi:HAMP domain-containing protein
MLLDQHGLRLALSNAKLNVPASEGGLLLTAIKDVPEDLQKQWVQDKRFGKTSGETPITVNPQRDLASLLDGGSAGNRTINGPGGSQEVSYAALATKPWTYTATVPTSVVTEPIDATIGRLTVIGLITAVLAAVAVFLFAQTLTRPIAKLAKVADAVSKGSTDVTVEEGSNDELGDLALAIRRMVASVKFYMNRSAQEQGEDSSGSASPAA